MLFICTFKDFVGLMRTIYLGDESISYDKQIGRSKFTTPVKILNYVLAFYFLKKSVNLTTSFFLDKHCIGVHKCKIRHTSFEIYRILAKLSFRVTL